MFKKKKNKVEDLLNVPYGSFKEIWFTLKRNKRAMFGLGFIILLVILAVFADVLAPLSLIYPFEI